MNFPPTVLVFRNGKAYEQHRRKDSACGSPGVDRRQRVAVVSEAEEYGGVEETLEEEGNEDDWLEDEESDKDEEYYVEEPKKVRKSKKRMKCQECHKVG